MYSKRDSLWLTCQTHYTQKELIKSRDLIDDCKIVQKSYRLSDNKLRIRMGLVGSK